MTPSWRDRPGEFAPGRRRRTDVPLGAVGRHYEYVLTPDARAELLVHAVDLSLKQLAPDCLSHAIVGVGAEISVVVQWHADGIHGGPSDLPRAWLSMDGALADPRGIEVLAEEIIGPEVRRHLLEDHRNRT